MEPTITPIEATLGATITDIDFGDLDDATWSHVENAFHEYAALIFPGQNITEDAQIAFACRLGEIEILRQNPDAKAVSISNRKPDGSILEPEENCRRPAPSNRSCTSSM